MMVKAPSEFIKGVQQFKTNFLFILFKDFFEDKSFLIFAAAATATNDQKIFRSFFNICIKYAENSSQVFSVYLSC